MAAPTTHAAGRDPDLLRRELRIARLLAAQDPLGLTELYELTARACFATITAIVRDPGHTEDVHQQVYAEAWRRAGEFDPSRGSLLTWVLVIARSRALDHLRRRAESPMEGDALAALGGTADDPGYDALLERAVIGELLEQLPAHERDLLRMRFWEGFTQTEIADLTGVPLGTIKSRMTAGLRRLRGLLDEQEGTR